MQTKTRIGFFSTGLNTYWDQFEGLLANLERYSASIVSRIRESGDVEVVDLGMVDSPQKASEAALRY